MLLLTASSLLLTASTTCDSTTVHIAASTCWERNIWDTAGCQDVCPISGLHSQSQNTYIYKKSFWFLFGFLSVLIILGILWHTIK